MFCPHCGKTNSAEQKFCRSCGLSLEKVAQSLAEQLPAAESNKGLQDRQRTIERALSIVLGGAFTVFVGAILWTLVYKIIIVKGEVLQGLMFLGLFLSLMIALLLVIYRESLREKLTRGKLSQTTSPLVEPTGELLPEGNLEPIPSVTERTTELLNAEREAGNKGASSTN